MKKMGLFNGNGSSTNGTNGNGQSAYRSSVISIGSNGSAGKKKFPFLSVIL